MSSVWFSIHFSSAVTNPHLVLRVDLVRGRVDLVVGVAGGWGEATLGTAAVVSHPPTPKHGGLPQDIARVGGNQEDCWLT